MKIVKRTMGAVVTTVALALSGGCLTISAATDSFDPNGHSPSVVGLVQEPGAEKASALVVQYSGPNHSTLLGQSDFLMVVSLAPGPGVRQVSAATTEPTTAATGAFASGPLVGASEMTRFQSDAHVRLLLGDAAGGYTVTSHGGVLDGEPLSVVLRPLPSQPDQTVLQVDVPYAQTRPAGDRAAGHLKAFALLPVSLVLDLVVNPVCSVIYMPIHALGGAQSFNPPWHVWH